MRPLRVVAAALFRDGELLAAKRPPGKRHGGRWELPGGKVEYGESDIEALHRELYEELGVKVVVGELLGENLHVDGWGSIRLCAYICTIIEGEPEALEHSELRWVNRAQLFGLMWAAADVPLLDRIATRLT